MKTNSIIVLFGLVIVIGFFTLAGIDMYTKNRPAPIPPEIVEESIMKAFRQDSIIKHDSIFRVPIEYRYVDSGFESNRDTTYWFFFAECGKYERVTRCIALPYSHFDFYAAAKYLEKKDVYITYFQQVSKASYISYTKYAKQF